MINFLQINIGVSPVARNLMLQTAREMDIDVIIISEHCRNQGEDHAWFDDSSGRCTLFVNNNVPIEVIGPPENGFRWLQIAGLRVYSVYWPPASSATFTSYTDFLTRLEGSIRTSAVPVVLAGDFNSKSPVWCSPTTDARGELLADMAASLNLHAANTGSPTFVRGASETHIDITFVSDAIVQRLADWRVLMDVESASYHKYITYSVQTAAPRPDTVTPEGWNWRKMDCEKLNCFLSSTSICESGVSELHVAINDYIKRACDVSMPKKKPRGARKPVFWWSDEIAELRKSSLAARRSFQRARKRRGPEECREEQQAAREALKALRLAVRKSQEKAWKALCDSVDQDPWGLPYRLVTKKLLGRRPIPELTAPGRLHAILSALFPSGPAEEHFTPQAEAPFTSISESEIVTIAHTLPSGKAPGPDGIPDAIIRAVALARPREVAMVFNQCLEKGLFPSAWKTARLVLIRKPGCPCHRRTDH